MASQSVLDNALAGQLIKEVVSHLRGSTAPSEAAKNSLSETVAVGIAALDAFLQANVTGPVLPASLCRSIDKAFIAAWDDQKDTAEEGREGLQQLRKLCLRHLEVDGVSPYALIPHIELFCLARYIFITALAECTVTTVDVSSDQGTVSHSIAWMRLRVNVSHYKLLTQPSLGPGSNFARSSQWSDVPTLESKILEGMDAVRGQVMGDEVWSGSEGSSAADKAKFLVEAANTHILLGRSEKAKETLSEATQTTGLEYALSGALGKRTKFQEKSTSQLVVLARSADGSQPTSGADKEDAAKPDALQLNDDTLLEEIHFTKEEQNDKAKTDTLPEALAALSPDDQPQLDPLDQIILLTEATLRDAFSPTDTLTSEEVLPFAVRVISDKSTNWQIYTQALLVRSRIETHRSRTVERGVLQLQAVADQVIADTTSDVTDQSSSEEQQEKSQEDVPTIQITEHNRDEVVPPPADKPTTFLPAPKPSESAPAPVRLRYIHALCAPPRWHLESELAYAWAGVGSLVSALEIFKRLHLWAEVALCLASSAAADDEDGRGSGGDEKAKGIIRWRLFQRTGESATANTDPDDDTAAVRDVSLLKAADFAGPERTPPPPNAPRLWCILGDLEDDPAHYERAWAISNNRFARAQRSLGEYHLQKKDLHKALEAYTKATTANRFSPDMWGRLGDINLRLGNFDAAAEAFTRSISSATDTAGGEDARTWSNLGSALWSQYCELTAEDKTPSDTAGDDTKPKADPSSILSRSLAAFKRGASIAHDNWRIWDNVVTLGSRVSPPMITDMVLALKHIIRIRKTEDALDADVLAAMLQDVVLSKDKEPGTTIYEPPRGSPERLITLLLEDEVAPLITYRHELWALLSRLRAWRRDYPGAVDAAERAWRAAIGSSSGGSLLPGAGAVGDDSAPSRDWTSDKTAWEDVVKRTDELASALETWGPDVETIGIKWRGRVRSAVRTVMSRGRESWEDSEEWKTLEGIMEGLKTDR
ncbi:hypothetical protein B0I35DRAFT_426694 [Stachybotrys elegans]|uniref:TPR repeat-containing protein n=1 Tax=Stachybotrys elegans TaxID=80388 RepID=A0A8K0SRZ3_9HYPO|nr:hypothetical protein B0I35DRAFT_426694 [Stachybotrys elegans]